MYTESPILALAAATTLRILILKVLPPPIDQSDLLQAHSPSESCLQGQRALLASIVLPNQPVLGCRRHPYSACAKMDCASKSSAGTLSLEGKIGAAESISLSAQVLQGDTSLEKVSERLHAVSNFPSLMLSALANTICWIGTNQQISAHARAAPWHWMARCNLTAHSPDCSEQHAHADGRSVSYTAQMHTAAMKLLLFWLGCCFWRQGLHFNRACSFHS